MQDKSMTIKSTALKVIDLMVRKKFHELPDDIAFCSNIFMIFGLPAHRIKENPAFWIKKSNSYDLIITRDPKYEIPYGCYARMNQIFIDTEVRIKNTNVIDVGRSFRDYTQKLGYKDGVANRGLAKQLLNYVTSSIKLDIKDPTPGHISGIHTVVAKAWDFFFDVPNPEQLTLFKGKIILSEDYARYIHDHSVPLDMNMIRCFKRNPLALDFYRFLAYRNNTLNKTISFPDHLLFQQLGTDQAAHFVTRDRLKKILKLIQIYWPVNAKFEDGFFELRPSPPAVQHKIPSKTPITITNKNAVDN